MADAQIQLMQGRVVAHGALRYAQTPSHRAGADILAPGVRQDGGPVEVAMGALALVLHGRGQLKQVGSETGRIVVAVKKPDRKR